MAEEIDFDKITRLEVIEGSGIKGNFRRYTKWDCKIISSVQDGGRTLKLFVSDRE